MKGSPKGQVTAVFRLSGMLQFGASRHKAKQAAKKAVDSKTSANISEKTGIHSWSTYNAYVRTGTEFCKFVKKEFSINDVEKITNEHVYEFLMSKVASNISYVSFKAYSSALMKLSTGLLRLNDEHTSWKESIQSAKDVAKVSLEIDETTRLYDNPEAIIQHLEEPFQLIGELQLYCGLRISEATKLHESELKNGVLNVSRTKGGRPRKVPVPKELEIKLRDTFSDGWNMVDRKQYAEKLKQACEEANEHWNGTHGLRWNYANRRMTELTRIESFESSLQKVSLELGHSRPEISSWYLRR